MMEPGPGVGPVPVGRRRRYPEHLGDSIERQAREVAKLDQSCFVRVVARQPVQASSSDTDRRSASGATKGSGSRPTRSRRVPHAFHTSSAVCDRSDCRRMAWAAVAKKWRRFSNCWSPTNRK